MNFEFGRHISPFSTNLVNKRPVQFFAKTEVSKNICYESERAALFSRKIWQVEFIFMSALGDKFTSFIKKPLFVRRKDGKLLCQAEVTTPVFRWIWLGMMLNRPLNLKILWLSFQRPNIFRKFSTVLIFLRFEGLWMVGVSLFEGMFCEADVQLGIFMVLYSNLSIVYDTFCLAFTHQRTFFFFPTVARFGVFLLRLTLNFFVVCPNDRIHVWHATVANLYSIPIENFV